MRRPFARPPARTRARCVIVCQENLFLLNSGGGESNFCARTCAPVGRRRRRQWRAKLALVGLRRLPLGLAPGRGQAKNNARGRRRAAASAPKAAYDTREREKEREREGERAGWRPGESEFGRSARSGHLDSANFVHCLPLARSLSTHAGPPVPASLPRRQSEARRGGGGGEQTRRSEGNNFWPKIFGEDKREWGGGVGEHDCSSPVARSSPLTTATCCLALALALAEQKVAAGRGGGGASRLPASQSKLTSRTHKSAGATKSAGQLAKPTRSIDIQSGWPEKGRPRSKALRAPNGREQKSLTCAFVCERAGGRPFFGHNRSRSRGRRGGERHSISAHVPGESRGVSISFSATTMFAQCRSGPAFQGDRFVFAATFERAHISYGRRWRGASDLVFPFSSPTGPSSAIGRRANTFGAWRHFVAGGPNKAKWRERGGGEFWDDEGGVC